MWGFSRSKTPSASKTSQEAKSSASLGIDPLSLDAHENLDNVHFSDADLNDPSLLAELKALTGGDDPSPSLKSVTSNHSRGAKQSPATKTEAISPNPIVSSDSPLFDVDAIVSNLPIHDHEEEVQVDLTEEDMNDPHLLAELHAIGGPRPAKVQDIPNNDDQETAFDVTPDSPTEPSSATSVTVPSLSTREDEDPNELPLEYKLKCNDAKVLAKYIQLEKIKAVSRKRAGDKAGALDSLRASKQLEQRLEQLTMDGSGNAPLPAIKSQATLSRKPVATGDPTMDGLTNSLESMSFRPQVSVAVPTVSLSEVQARCLEYKKAALAAKKAQAIDKAREYLIVAKKLEGVIEQYNVTGDFLPDLVLPETPSTVFEAVANRKAQTPPAPIPERHSSSQSSATKPSDLQPSPSPDLFSLLETTLVSQIQLCTTVATQYFSQGQKDRALDFHKRKKNLQIDLDTLRGLKPKFTAATPTTALPLSFHYTTLEYTISQMCMDVPTDEMHVCIGKGVDFSVKDVISSDLETVVTFDLGWPQDGESTSAEGKGEVPTPVVGSQPNFDFTKKVKITRNRPFQRFIERKKMTFDLYYLKSGFLSLLKSRVPFGRVTVKLDSLLNKCEIHDMFPIMDPSNPRKAVGGKLEIQVKLRVPLVKADNVLKSEKWLVLQFGQQSIANSTPVSAVNVASISTASLSPSAVSNTVSPSSAVSTSKTSPRLPSKAPATTTASIKAAQPTSTNPPSKPTSRSTTPTPQETTSTKPTATTPESLSASTTEDIDSLELTFLTPDNIMSNQVLEFEHGQILKQISGGAAKADMEELADKKNAYELRMNMLVTMVQLGKLTMEGYIQLVKKSIEDTKKMALSFKKAGRLDLAKQALQRVKLMTAEVEEVENQG